MQDLRRFNMSIISFAIIFFGIIILISIIFVPIYVRNTKGRIGERETEAVLERFENQKYNIYGRTLRNVYIPKSNSGTAETDVLFVTAKGIIVLESKNISGWVFGKEWNQYWTVILPAGRGKSIKNKLYNPIIQNENHIKYLREYLKKVMPNKDIKYFNVVVFSDRCELKDVKHSNKICVVQRFELFDTIKKILDKEELSLTNVQVDTIYNELEKMTKVDKEVKDAHIESIQAQKYSFAKKVDGGNCPKCGSKLVIRVAKQGPWEGKQFYGCSSYPKCNYLRNIED